MWYLLTTLFSRYKHTQLEIEGFLSKYERIADKKLKTKHLLTQEMAPSLLILNKTKDIGMPKIIKLYKIQ